MIYIIINKLDYNTIYVIILEILVYIIRLITKNMSR